MQNEQPKATDLCNSIELDAAINRRMPIDAGFLLDRLREAGPLSHVELVDCLRNEKWDERIRFAVSPFPNHAAKGPVWHRLTDKCEWVPPESGKGRALVILALQYAGLKDFNLMKDTVRLLECQAEFTAPLALDQCMPF